jgi:hypothetical protein
MKAIHWERNCRIGSKANLLFRKYDSLNLIVGVWSFPYLRKCKTECHILVFSRQSCETKSIRSVFFDNTMRSITSTSMVTDYCCCCHNIGLMARKFSYKKRSKFAPPKGFKMGVGGHLVPHLTTRHQQRENGTTEGTYVQCLLSLQRQW